MNRTRIVSEVVMVSIVLLFPGLTVMAHPTSTLSIVLNENDYQMQVENTTGWTGDTNHVFHIMGSWASGIKEYSMKLFYDTTKIHISDITLDGCVVANASSFFSENVVPNGYIHADVKKTSGIPSGAGALFTIVVNISVSAPQGKTLLNLEDGSSTYFVTIQNETKTPVTIDGSLDIRTGNHPPEAPIISGPIAGGPGIELNFSAATTDYEGDKIVYKWDWGDGNISGWSDPFNGSEPMLTHHNWLNESTYVIEVFVKDENGNDTRASSVTISIAPQITLESIKPGFIYFHIFSFNKSYFYISLLSVLEASIIISTEDLVVSVNATSAVQQVRFEAFTPLIGDTIVREDNTSGDGFSSSFNLSLGLYQLSAFAYDAQGNLIDMQVLPYVLFLRVGQSGVQHASHLRHALETRR